MEELFDFQKLIVYQRIRSLNAELLPFLNRNEANIDLFLRDQLKRASLSVAINLAEGVGRLSKPDKKRFFVMSRSSVNECVALLDILLDNQKISKDQYASYFSSYTEVSKMLWSLGKRL
jgi:four helix bundle protein